MVIVWNMPSLTGQSPRVVSMSVWFEQWRIHHRDKFVSSFILFGLLTYRNMTPHLLFCHPSFTIAHTHSQHFVPREEGSNMKESGSLLSLSTTTFSNQMLRGRKWKKKVRGEKATKKFFFFPFFSTQNFTRKILMQFLYFFLFSRVFFSGACWVLWAPLTSRHVLLYQIFSGAKLPEVQRHRKGDNKTCCCFTENLGMSPKKEGEIYIPIESTGSARSIKGSPRL